MGIFADKLDLSKREFAEMIVSAKNFGYEPTVRGQSVKRVDYDIGATGLPRSIAQGMTFGGADEIVGGGAALFGGKGTGFEGLKGLAGFGYEEIDKMTGQETMAYYKTQIAKQKAEKQKDAVDSSGVLSADSLDEVMDKIEWDRVDRGASGNLNRNVEDGYGF